MQITRLLRYVLIGVALDGFILFVLWYASTLQNQLETYPADELASLPNPILIAGFFSSISEEKQHRVQALHKISLALPSARVIIAGGWRPQSIVQNGAEEMATLLVAIGVESERVSYDTGSNDSVSNLQNILASPAYQTAESVIFISNARHMLRIKTLLRGMDLDKPALFLTNTSETRFSSLVWELHYELAAWLSMALPRRWVDAFVGQLRK